MPGLDDCWRRSSYSGTSGNCMEAACRDEAVLVRGSKQHGDDQVHRFTAAEWSAFVATVKADAFDSKV